MIYFSFLNNNVFGIISVSFSNIEYILLNPREMRLLKIHEIKVRGCMLINKGVCVCVTWTKINFIKVVLHWGLLLLFLRKGSRIRILTEMNIRTHPIQFVCKSLERFTEMTEGVYWLVNLHYEMEWNMFYYIHSWFKAKYIKY